MKTVDSMATKSSHRHNGENVVDMIYIYSAFIFDRVFFKIAGTRPGIKSWTSLISGPIQLFSLKLLPLQL